MISSSNTCHRRGTLLSSGVTNGFCVGRRGLMRLLIVHGTIFYALPTNYNNVGKDETQQTEKIIFLSAETAEMKGEELRIDSSLNGHMARAVRVDG